MTAHAESEAKTQEFDPDARYVGADYIEYRNFADFLREKPINSVRNIHIRVSLQAFTEAELRAWTQAYDREAYEGPVRRPQNQEHNSTWHSHCVDAGNAAVRRLKRSLPRSPEGAG